MNTYTTFQNFTLLVLRIIVAVIFFVAAYFKIPFWSMSPPEGMSYFLYYTTLFLSIAEPLGAVAVLIGFLTRLAAAGLTIIMIGAIFVSQFVFNIGFTTPTAPGWDFPLAVLGGCLILVSFGARQWSVDERKTVKM